MSKDDHGTKLRDGSGGGRGEGGIGLVHELGQRTTAVHTQELLWGERIELWCGGVPNIEDSFHVGTDFIG